VLSQLIPPIKPIVFIINPRNPVADATSVVTIDKNAAVMPQSMQSSIDETLASACARQLALLHHPGRRFGSKFHKDYD
jgi:hypothetical protein